MTLHRSLAVQVAWRELGVYPTPVHRGTVVGPRGGAPLRFLVKREDLASPRYGGNKVRTLQHQLAVVEARAARVGAGGAGSSSDQLVVMGTGGSNQIVATVAHARRTTHCRTPTITRRKLQPF